MKRRAYIGLGANQGDLVGTLEAAIDSLRPLERSEFIAVSPYYRSAPVDAQGPDYLNAVVALETELEPYSLLLHLLELEVMLGRKRHSADGKRNAPRNVDLDLLMVGSLIVRSTPLTLPHPRMRERAFVLRPLYDLAPTLSVPGQGFVSDLLAKVSHQRIERFDGKLWPTDRSAE